MAATIAQNPISVVSRSATFKIDGLRTDGRSQLFKRSFEPAVRRRRVVMVCWPGSDRWHDELLRKGFRDAEAMDADWYVVNVEVPTLHFATSTADRRRTMTRELRSAVSNGAKIVFLKAHDVARALLDFAWDARVDKIIIGRSRPGVLHRLFSPSVAKALLKRAHDVEVEVVGYQRKIHSSPPESFRVQKNLPARLPRVADFRNPEYSR